MLLSFREQASQQTRKRLIMLPQMTSTAVSDIRDHAERRMRELQPLLEEAEQLRQVIELLDRQSADGAASVPVPALVAAEPAEGRAPQGSNKRRILALALEQPGITAADIARVTGLKRTLVASTMSRLKRTGELEQHGRGARVPVAKAAETHAHVAA